MTIKEMTVIMIIMIITISLKTKRIMIEEMINLITKSVVAKIEILSNFLTIKGKS